MMNLEAIYFVSQVVAAVAIVASLIFVGVQIRQNTKATRAASAFEVNRMWGEMNIRLSGDDDTVLFISKLFDPGARREDLTELQWTKAAYFCFAQTQLWFAQFRMYQEGSLSKEDWELHGRWAAHFYQLPLLSEMDDVPWMTWVRHTDFADEIERLGKLEGMDIDFNSRFETNSQTSKQSEVLADFESGETRP